MGTLEFLVVAQSLQITWNQRSSYFLGAPVRPPGAA